MPDSWANALAPTTALLAGTANPVQVATSFDSRDSWVVSMPVSSPIAGRRVRSAITSSSSEQLPARSPMPLTATSAWRAPARKPAIVLATARPRSSWQWTETITSLAPGTVARIPAIKRAELVGRV